MPNWGGNRMSNIHPDELYEQLCENATSRKKKTLTLVHEVCKKQSESDVKDFSLGTIAGLMAEGETTVGNIKLIDRGYENLVEKLTAVGADISRANFEDEKE